MEQILDKKKSVKFWLIYADDDGRKAKPFYSIEVMNRYIDRNKNQITIIAKTKTI